MKKVLIFFLIGVCSSGLFAETIRISSSKCYLGDVGTVNIWGECGLADMVLYYNRTSESYELYIASDVCFFLSKDDFHRLQMSVQKALDWKMISALNNVSIEKEIPDSKLNLKYKTKNSSGEWVQALRPASLSFVFKAVPSDSNWIMGNLEYFGILIHDSSSDYQVKPFSVRDMTFEDYEFWEFNEHTLTSLSEVVSKESIESAIMQADRQANADSLFQ